MSREWKPGDVAKAAYPDWSAETYTERLIVRGSGCWVRLDDTDDFVHDDSANRPANPRRMVVIDPEDLEQVERFTHLFLSHYWSDTDAQTHTDAGQAALREFSNPTPPKPDEPTGLGAVVEDAEGARWVLVFEKGMWQRADDRDVWRLWPAVDAVRVLSEGVQP